MKKKIIVSEEIPEINDSINELPKDSFIFVGHTFQIAKYIANALPELGTPPA